MLASDHPLTIDQRHTLRRLAGLMIPESTEYAVPGADDDVIFQDILGAARSNTEAVKQALDMLDALGEGHFVELDAAIQGEVCERFRSSGSPLVGVVVALVTQCYYRDDRVMRSLGMEPRPPFPLGFEVEDGDWSLLDPVRARPKMYRDV